MWIAFRVEQDWELRVVVNQHQVGLTFDESCRWLHLLRSVWAWLTLMHWLKRCWRAYFAKIPPVELAALVKFLIGKDGLVLHLGL